MKTTFLLFGGATRKNYSKTKQFFEEGLSKLVQSEINFLLVYFAKDESRWDECRQRDVNIISQFPDKNINFVLADAENFDEQAKKAEIVYLQGGDGPRIKNALEKFDLNKIFAGKIILANSAGVNVLAKYYYDNDYDRIDEGLGILPIKIICHFAPEVVSKLEALNNYKEELEVVALPECEYITKEINE